MKQISISVDPSRFDNPIHRGMDALKQLQQRGVPVVGVLFPEAVTHGTLHIGSADLVTGEITYSWDPEGAAA